MRLSLLAAFAFLSATSLAAQPVGKFPPDSLINVQVIPKTTPVIQVIGQMRNMTGALGVRCQFCHVGEGNALERFDFASDEKRNKLVARQMMRMVAEINRRIDTIPQRGNPPVPVTCLTCHRGLNRPVALATLVADAAIAVNADSATRMYRALRERYFGRDAFDFSEFSLNSAALRVARANKFDDAFALLTLNEEVNPNRAMMYVFRGNIHLIKGDTNSAVTAFREALRRDSTNSDARSRLRDIGRTP
jgi:photosynthetic reaction center cytochrome c subunit